MKEQSLSVERLRLLFIYDPEAGTFTRTNVPVRGARPGTVAGSTNTDGYRVIRIDRRDYYAHRLAWLYVHGEWPPDQLDHKNGNRADNRIANLRLATDVTNRWNQTVTRPNNTSGMMGVGRSGRGWRAQIMHNRKNTYLGTFDTPEEAHAAYLKAKSETNPFK